MLGGSVEVLTKNNLHRFIESQTHLGIAKLGPTMNQIGCSSFKFKHYLRACTTSGKKALIVDAKQAMENHMELTPDKKSH
jgi:phosphosulfolactate synthase (CoM biosynthesis protein A)